MFTPHGEISRI